MFAILAGTDAYQTDDYGLIRFKTCPLLGG